MPPPPPLPNLEPLLTLWLCAVGACVGSFLNVVIFRLPRRCLSVMRPARSFCPNCHHAIRWYENLPIISWLALRARCAGCAQPISARYPLVEAAVMLLFGLLVLRDLHGRWHLPEAYAIYAVHALFGCALLACALIDYDLQVIPDAIDVPGLLLAPLAVALLPGLLGPRLPDLASWSAQAALALDSPLRWWGIPAALAPLEALAELRHTHPALYPHVQGLAGGVLGAALAAGALYGVGKLSGWLVRRDALGLGDVKLVAMIGGLTGWQGAMITLLVGSVLGLVGGVLAWGSGRAAGGQRLHLTALRFGPFLSIGGGLAAFLPFAR
ncbi:MAG: A24 family peptidase [Planctomycetota bacterium]